MSEYSDPVIRAVAERIYLYNYSGEAPDLHLASVAIRAAHDPALGLDRSVCLRDVVDFVRKVQVERAVCSAADIEREFGGET